jgi:hypothetical protein
MIDGFWLSTCILMVMTLGVVYFRYSTQNNDSNWPLVYYSLAVLYMQWFPDTLSQNLVFATVLLAMFIRFEFLSGMILKGIQLAEVIGLLLITYNLFDQIFH